MLEYQKDNGYWMRKVAGRWLYRHRAVWEEAHGPIPAKHHIDHINGVRGDDRLSNLQLVTNAVNCRLGVGELKSRNTTGYNCVHQHRNGRWYGLFRFEGRRVYCGYHDTAELANYAVLLKREELNAPTRRVAT